MAKIDHITACEVLDSRGNPTVMATVVCEGGIIGEAMVPSGASTGTHEAFELRDKDEKRFCGMGVLKAVKNIKGEINAALSEKDTSDQVNIDGILLELDNTPNKSRLGANAMLAVSLACARAEAVAQGLPLYLYLQQLYPKREFVFPIPQMNLINGGRHASNGLSVQEFHVLPVGASSFNEALRMGVEIYKSLRELFIAEGWQVEVGDEGGFAPKLRFTELAFTFLVRAIEKAGYAPGIDACLGVDAAASEFYNSDNETYVLDGAQLSADDLAEQYKIWRTRYPLISIEDPFHEDDWHNWCEFTKSQGHAIQVVGDDLYATNTARITDGIKRQASNAVLIKLNQVGTLSETLQAILLAQNAGLNAVISHRSGETEDSFIADLSIAVGAGQIKAGAPCRSDRTAKYNRLLSISAETENRLSDDMRSFIDYPENYYVIMKNITVK